MAVWSRFHLMHRFYHLLRTLSIRAQYFKTKVDRGAHWFHFAMISYEYKKPFYFFKIIHSVNCQYFVRLFDNAMSGEYLSAYRENSFSSFRFVPIWYHRRPTDKKPYQSNISLILIRNITWSHLPIKSVQYHIVFILPCGFQNSMLYK